jgi:hypothetical protein
MKFKSILLTAVATLGLTAATYAQTVPNYVPTNGLVGWWPFNGNANDESGNGNNGTVNGATLTTDRFGNTNKAYNFDGVDDEVIVNNSIALNFPNQLTISAWFAIDIATLTDPLHLICKGNFNYSLKTAIPNRFSFGVQNIQDVVITPENSYNVGEWIHYVIVYNFPNATIYLNGINVASGSVNSTINPNNSNLTFGSLMSQLYSQTRIDDVGIWNRPLNPQEISNLHNAVSCSNNTTITPQSNSLTIGNTATFTATTTDPNPSYIWQSNFGQGFQTLNNFGNYSGVNTATLNIANVQLPNHTQPIRVITTSGNCIDTSNVAVINILDTCLVTVYDTLLTTVTDTLVINATITGINPPNNLNTLKVFPNPANTHITIDYGNFNAMSGYTLTIVNSVGQTVFTTPINQQTSYIDLSTWTGNGIYFVQLIDPQNNTIENRKIVIQ